MLMITFFIFCKLSIVLLYTVVIK